MPTDDTTREWREQISTDRRTWTGMIRRMAITLTNGAFWQVVGHLLIDGKTKETREAEVFSGIGFYARPKARANAEALVVFPGGAANPVVVGTRDEDVRKKVANIDQDEAAAYNTVAVLHITKGAQIHARTPGGTAVELAKVSELNDLRAFVAAQFSGAGHAHGVSGAATNSTVPVGIPPTAYAGTDVLKGQ